MYKGNAKKGEIEILSEKLIFENKFVKFYNDNVLFPSGKEGTYYRLENLNPGSVAILPIVDDKYYAMLHIFRHGARSWGYEIPKGGVEPGETLEEAAKRELVEETGMTCERLIYVGNYNSSPDTSSCPMSCFIAEKCVHAVDKKYDLTESIDGYELFPLSKNPTEINSLYNDTISELLYLKYLVIQGEEDGR